MEYKDKINDYRISLLDVGRMENLQDYHGELKALLGFVRYQKDDEQLEQFVRQNQALFSKISMETVQAMAVLGNAGNLKSYIHPDSDKEESIMYADVNEALQKMMDKKWNEGQGRPKYVQPGLFNPGYCQSSGGIPRDRPSVVSGVGWGENRRIDRSRSVFSGRKTNKPVPVQLDIPFPSP